MSENSQRHCLVRIPSHRAVECLFTKNTFRRNEPTDGIPPSQIHNMLCIYPLLVDLDASELTTGANTSCGSDTPRSVCRPILSSPSFAAAAKLDDVTIERPSSTPTFSSRAA